MYWMLQFNIFIILQQDTFIQYNDKANIKIIHETQLQIILLTISLYVVENCVCLLFTFEIFWQ